MLTYEETLDPSEVRSFEQPWGDQLGDGEALIGIAAVTFINAAGTTQPSAATFATNSTMVWLTGGTPGSTAIFSVRVTTSRNRTLEKAFAVLVRETTYVPPAETEIERLTREIVEAKSQRALVATGQAVIDVWRDGRRIRKMIPTLKELEAYIRQLEGELYTAQLAAGVTVTPRRAAIDLAWRN
jgi:hypothetical protein